MKITPPVICYIAMEATLEIVDLRLIEVDLPINSMMIFQFAMLN